jgi:hypothetical protein
LAKRFDLAQRYLGEGQRAFVFVEHVLVPKSRASARRPKRNI